MIPVPDGATAPAYVDWDPAFESHRNAIERAESRILQFNGIAPVLVDQGK